MPASRHQVEPLCRELVINLKTAKALGLTGPPTLSPRAPDILRRGDLTAWLVAAFTVEPVSGLQHPQELGKIMGKQMLPLEYKVHTGLPRP